MLQQLTDYSERAYGVREDAYVLATAIVQMIGHKTRRRRQAISTRTVDKALTQVGHCKRKYIPERGIVSAALLAVTGEAVMWPELVSGVDYNSYSQRAYDSGYRSGLTDSNLTRHSVCSKATDRSFIEFWKAVRESANYAGKLTDDLTVVELYQFSDTAALTQHGLLPYEAMAFNLLVQRRRWEHVHSLAILKSCQTLRLDPLHANDLTLVKLARNTVASQTHSDKCGTYDKVAIETADALMQCVNEAYSTLKALCQTN